MAVSRISNSSIANGFPKYQNFENLLDNTPVTSGLIYYLDAGISSSYSGSGSTWNDISGSGKTLTLYNSPTFTSNGTKSYFTFNGTSHYGEGDASGLISGLSSVTCSVWYRPLSSDNDGMVYDHHNYPATGTSRDNFSIRQNWGGSPGTVTSGYTQNSSNTFNYVKFEDSNNRLGKWRNYTQVIRDGVMYAYVNGEQKHSQSVSGTVRTTNWLRIGQDAINSNYLNADFAVIQTFNRGLTDAEIARNFNYFKGRYGY